MSFEGYESQLRELGECLREKTLIPFIGAGLSQPFEVPMWDSLIEDIANEFVESDYLPAVKSHLKQKKYFKAVDSIIDFGIKDELEIQEKIVEIIKRKVSTDIDNSSHNYSDLAEMGFHSHITTNYDNLLQIYLSKKGYVHTENLADLKADVKNTLDNRSERRIWRLHGDMYNPGTIVISENKYKECYGNEKYIKLFEHIIRSNTILFLGFSFDDWYIQRLFEDCKQYFNRKNYILLCGASIEKRKEYKEKYRLDVISYPDDDKHALHIKTILNEIYRNSHASFRDILNSIRLGTKIERKDMSDLLNSLGKLGGDKEDNEHIDIKEILEAIEPYVKYLGNKNMLPNKMANSIAEQKHMVSVVEENYNVTK